MGSNQKPTYRLTGDIRRLLLPSDERSTPWACWNEV